MQSELLNEEGVCLASIRSEIQIRHLQRALEEAAPRLDSLGRWIDAIKDPTRLRIVHLLYLNRQLCVCDLANALGVSSSAVSQHLRKLKDMGFVEAERFKQTVFHRLGDPDFVHFCDTLMSSEGAADGETDRTHTAARAAR